MTSAYQPASEIAHVDGDEQLQLVQRALRRLGIGEAGDGIMAVGEVGADAVGLPRLHGGEGLV